MPQLTITDYRNLLRDYQELQLRVTRFSYVEQQLRNTQDKLDHELILYKRLSGFSSRAFNTRRVEEFLQMAVEAIVDILEIETAAILIHEHATDAQHFFSEGFRRHEDGAREQFCTEIRSMSELVAKSKSVLLPPKRLQLFPLLQHYSDGMFHHATEEKLGVSVYLIGLVSSERAPFYEKLYDKHETIFNLFSQQFLSILKNFYQNLKIQEQIRTITESEHELRTLSLIARKTKNGVMIIDRDETVEWVNDSYATTTGFAYHDVVGKKLRHLLSEHTVEYADKKRIISAMQNRDGLEMTAQSRTKSGTIFYCKLEIIPVFDEANQLLKYIFVFKDITDETRFKDQILKINSRFQLVAQEAKVGIWEWNKEAGTSQWNDVLIHQYGIENQPKRPTYFDYWLKALHPDDKEHVMQCRQRVIDGDCDSIKTRYRIFTPTGQMRHLDAHIIAEKDDYGRVIGLIGSSIDVTDLIMVDEKVARLKQFYENILNHLPSLVAVFDEGQHLVYLNDAMLETNPFLESNMGRHIHDIEGVDIHSSAIVKNLAAHLDTTRASGQAENYNETIVVHHRKLELLGTALPFSLSDGQMNTIVSFTDVTQLNKFQKDLLRKNSELRKVNSELDNFVYRVSHDLRSPLLSIKGILSLVDGESTSPELQEYHRLIHDSTARMDNSIKDILEYSRNSRLDVKYERVNVRQMVQEIFDDIRYYPNSPVQLQFVPGCEEYIISDKVRINVLLKNLIGNGMKYRRDIPDSFIRFGMTKHRKFVQITVTDNGKGIARNKVKKVFDMFYRGCSDSVGSGLGLYICREIIAKLHGKITLNSKLDEGTQICIQLPLNEIKS